MCISRTFLYLFCQWMHASRLFFFNLGWNPNLTSTSYAESNLLNSSGWVGLTLRIISTTTSAPGLGRIRHGCCLHSSSAKDAKIDPARMSRTIGCVDWTHQVRLNRPSGARRAGNEPVKELWNQDKVLTCPREQLWKNDGLIRGHQPLEPQYPVLMPDALCLMLPKTRREVWVYVSRVLITSGALICSAGVVCSFCICAKVLATISGV